MLRAVMTTVITGALLIVDAAIKRVLKVVGDKVRRLQEEIDLVGAATLHAVARRHPGGVLGRRPVKLGHDVAAELVNGVTHGTVHVRPQRGRIVVFAVRVGQRLHAGEDAAVGVGVCRCDGRLGRQNDAIGPEVGEKRRRQRYEPDLGGKGAISKVYALAHDHRSSRVVANLGYHE